jgi:chorismate synthase
VDSFGHNFRTTVFGESHGKCVGVVVDGVRPGIRLSEADFAADLSRRKSAAAGTTRRMEKDEPRILSGVCNGFTTGAPIAIIFDNNDTKPEDYGHIAAMPRPSHADLAARKKYGGFNDPRGGGQFSGRMTLALVAAGVIAKKMVPEISFDTRIVAIGGSRNRDEFDGIIERAAAAGDSVGGIVECVATGVPAGTGEPFFDSVESVAGHLLFSIPAVKGVEFGAGFGAASSTGSANNDTITDSHGTTATNNDGGVNGGMANGNPVVVRVAVKPAPSISIPQQTYDFEAGATGILSTVGRHDACIALRAAVVVEAAMALTFAELAE